MIIVLRLMARPFVLHLVARNIRVSLKNRQKRLSFGVLMRYLISL
jgi:hypothetical protein